MLLLGAAGLAATAVTGCVSVAPDATHAKASRPDTAPTARRRSGTRPQVVQAPAEEALSMVRPTAPAAPAPRPAATTAPPRVPRQRAAAAGTGSVHRGEGAPQAHGPGRLPAGGREHPHAAPAAPPALPGDASGVCTLGETYGHWPAGSPQARICHQTYGH